MPEPKVRFKRDDGSSYPAWTAGKLGDITEQVHRKAPKGSTAPVMMVSQGNGFIYQADKYSRENAGQSLKNYTLLKQGEFAYNHGASKAKPYGVAYCLTEEQEARVPFVYHTFRMVDGINPYWHEALNTSKMDRQLKRMVSSGARMDGLLNINYDTYMDVDVNIPCLEEQQKIADFLSSVDKVIAASEEEVANLETQKKAVMKKIFTQEVRFKRADGSDFPAWVDNYRLEEVSDFITKGATPTTYGFDWVEEGIPFFRNDAIRDNTFVYGDYSYISEEAHSSLSRSEIRAGDLLIAITGEIGKVGMVPKNIAKGNINQHTARVRIIREYIPYFVYQYLCSDTIQNGYKKIKTGLSMAQLSLEQIRDTKIPVVNIEEQHLIADFLSDFDEAITSAKKELELWKELKKGLLQQMFV